MVKKTYPLLFLIVMSFFSCSEDNTWGSLTIGGTFLTSESGVKLIDTMSLSLSTFVIDSIPSNSPANLMVGQYIDEYYGEVSSSSYFEITYPSFSDLDEYTGFDSLVMVLHYNGLYYGDTTKQQTINIHQVLDEMEEPDDAYFYNTTKFSYSDEPIGSATFTPRPNFDDTLCIRMSDAFGEELLQMMIDDDGDFDDMDHFQLFLRGLALVPGDEDATILGFSPADTLVTMKLYAHHDDVVLDELLFEFPLYSSTTCFNNFQADRTGTYLEGLTTQKNNIASGEMDSKAYVQGGTGIVTRLDFSDLNRINQTDENAVLYKAELVLRPYTDSDEQIDYPEELMLYTTDKYNNLTSAIQNDDGETLIADFNYDDTYRDDINYTFDITDFIKDELSAGFDEEEDGLIICFPSSTFKSTSQRIVFDARSGNNYRPKLNLYFIYYDNDN